MEKALSLLDQRPAVPKSEFRRQPGKHLSLMRILLDTNILLRSVVTSHPQSAVSSGAIELLQERNHDLVIVPQVLYEFWAVATRPVSSNGLGMPIADALAQLVEAKELFRLLRDERAIYETWEQLVTSLNIKGKPAHDARLAAAMLRHGVTHIMTFNEIDFGRFSMISAFSPESAMNGAVAL